MSDKQGVDKLLYELKRERDELRLQLHLGSMEAREQWGEISEKVNQLTEQFEPVKDAIEESASDVLESIQSVGTELLNGLRRVRDSLSD
ncbi:MAG: hypothetical protein ACE361_26390 [Aureliella sp.]